MRIASELKSETGIDIKYKVGTMIELPKAALQADEIAQEAQFFSFGTNDLTQTTFGISRDDSVKFLDNYKSAGIFKVDPFVSIDQNSVGELMKIAIQKGRNTNRELSIGICGEHAGDPTSIEFCQKIGINYISCSPYRIPIAKISAAQARIKQQREEEAEVKAEQQEEIASVIQNDNLDTGKAS